MPARKPAAPHAPARTEDEGVTSATVGTAYQQRRRSSHDQRPSRRSGSSHDFEARTPERSHSLKQILKRNRSEASDGDGSHGRSRSQSRRDSRHRKRGPDLLQQAADSLDPRDPDGARRFENGDIDQQRLAEDNPTLEHPDASQTEKRRELVRKLKPTRLVDLHRLRPDIANKRILPTVAFPGQGTGHESEFLQEAPIWSRYPWKALYLVYFGLSVGLVFLPWFAFISLFPSQRPRASWTWKRATLVRLYRHGTRLTFRTHTNLSRDLSKPVPHSETLRCKFIWIDPTPRDEIRGELARAMKEQRIESTRTCGFWYGEPLSGDLCEMIEAAGAGAMGVGRRAGVDEKVVFHLHGGAYWIGTAHEKDVTAAVNTEVLRHLSDLYKANQSKSKENNRCTRSLSLDYRLSAPNQPRIGSYPAALLDAIAGYLYLIRFCGFKARNIIIAGDSAGGNLALALCRYLRDEKIEEMPGCLLLLSPWADVSRSHSGPLGAVNLFSSASRNKGADIISKSVAFRNTAVSAFIGDLPARETYRNPYMSSCSLQLDPSQGGDGPDWGFEGFPNKTYIVTGSAEISNDQHLTLAHRMASGSKQRRPIYTGDELSKDEDPFEMAARLNYPRPSDHEISLWPSATATPAGDMQAVVAKKVNSSSSGSSSTASNTMFDVAGAVEGGRAPRAAEAVAGDAVPRTSQDHHVASDGVAEQSKKDDIGVNVADFEGNDVNGQSDTKTQLRRAGLPAEVHSGAGQVNKDKMHLNILPEAQSRPEQSQVRSATSTTATTPSGLSRQPRRPQLMPISSSAAFSRAQSRADIRVTTPRAGMQHPLQQQQNGPAAVPLLSEMPPHHIEAESADAGVSDEEGEGYFDVGGEERQVWLDEVKDGVHDLLLFPWHEPERGQCWKRIARWIDEA